MLNQLMPGYKDKLWARYTDPMKRYFIASQNDAWEKPWKDLRWFRGMFMPYKATEEKMKPTFKSRKPYVDWQRQKARGVLHVGRWYEGPDGSDYTPGNTVDRLQNVKAPFTEQEWAERKAYRTWDLLTIGAIFMAGFLYYRVSVEWPVVWCEEPQEEETEA